jgi:hypothetical protein
MNALILFCLVQLYLAFGLAGMVWPDKFMSLFGVLMFPWPASYRVIRANGLAAITVYLILVGKLWVAGF